MGEKSTEIQKNTSVIRKDNKIITIKSQNLHSPEFRLDFLRIFAAKRRLLRIFGSGVDDELPVLGMLEFLMDGNKKRGGSVIV